MLHRESTIANERLQLPKAKHYMRTIIAAATDLTYEEAKTQYSAKSGRIHGQTKLQNQLNMETALAFTRHKTKASALRYNRPNVHE